MNSVILTGKAATDPELRYTPNGKAVANVRIAVGTGRKGKSGQELTDYFTVVVWGDRAEQIGEKLSKGQMIMVQGRLTNESWTGQDGKKRYNVKVVASSLDIVGEGEVARVEGNDDEAPEPVDPD